MIVLTMKNTTPLNTIIQTGDSDCSYEAEIHVDKSLWWKGKIEHHDCMDGIGDLLRKVAEQTDKGPWTVDDAPGTVLVKPASYRNLLDGSIAGGGAPDEPWLAHGR